MRAAPESGKHTHRMPGLLTCRLPQHLLRGFQPFFEGRRDHLWIIVPDRSIPDWAAESERRRALGFNKYEKKTGRVIIANACTQLSIDALGMGFTTKDAHHHLVGHHGEGLKLAALILSLDGYQARLVASDARLAGRLLEPSTTIRVWQYLLRESAYKQFFYSENSNDQNLLPAHCSIRTVEKEQQEPFKVAKPYTVPNTAFARIVDQALQAYFALLKFTDHIPVVYVKGLTNKADVYFGKGQVEELLVRSIASMFKAHPKSRPAEIKFMGQIGLRLRYLPHSIKLKPYPRGILVSWEDNETEAFRTLGSGGPNYHVLLHEGNCASAETAFLHEKAALTNEVVPCGCRRQFARQTHRMCLFTGLSHTSTYYAMIALDEDRAFYGVPSDRTSPGSFENGRTTLQ
ncbi:hypothetical protein PMG11_11108 [Penicillium brasilianum]|uniref:Uncharacterized protein n=1 Tax=Penicillium brasilianum TaxID=104259 RepID=A0A0F7U2X3_PENBI|nr:hypothetical protein PMG11_11108 [Penicillium brasilianum]